MIFKNTIFIFFIAFLINLISDHAIAKSKVATVKTTDIEQMESVSEDIRMVREDSPSQDLPTYKRIKSLPDIIENLLPTVVAITSVKEKNYIDTKDGFYEDNVDKNPRTLGSGFLISADGYIVTNNHVVEGSDAIFVSLKGSQTQFPADIVGVDQQTDLALLKIEVKTELPFVEFDTNPDYKIGDEIIVVGNPYNLGISVSTGIISALNRDLQNGTYDNFIQTDAAINRGNSGGPMFSMEGKVIGVTSAIYSPNGANVGIGFAVPVVDTLSVIEELKKYGYVRRGWIGLSGVEMNKDIFKALNLNRKSGILITDVDKNGPADKAGIKVSDIIVSYNGKNIKKLKDLPNYITSSKIGSKIPLSIIRDGKVIDYRVSVEESKEHIKYDSDEESIIADSFEIFDMYVIPINKITKKFFNLDNDFGLYVLKVKKGGLAFKKGIRASDTLKYINQSQITSKNVIMNVTEVSRKANLNSVYFIIEKANGMTQVVLMPTIIQNDSNQKLKI